METLVHSNGSREEIVERIVFTIARKWQIDEREITARFDPLMMMLVEVIAQELDIINSQWEQSLGEITESVLERFFPYEQPSGERPRVMVLQARPNESKAVVPAFFDFSLQQNEEAVHFTPIHETRIFNIRQLSLWANREPYSAGHQSQNPQPLQRIGLLCERAADLKSLDGLQLHLSTGHFSERSILLYAMQHARCTVNGEAVELRHGYKVGGKGGTPSWDSLQEVAAALYSGNFLTLSQKEPIAPLPAEHPILQKLSDRERKNFDLNTAVYIEWELPVQLQARWLAQLQVSLNAFVGIGRKQHSLQYPLDAFVNVIPLVVEQHLLFVEQVKGDGGAVYQALDFLSEAQLADGSYLLRRSEFGKMSSDSLRYRIQDLKNQVNSSSAFFSTVSNDVIDRHLQEMQRIVYRLEDKLRPAQPLKQEMHYLIVKPQRNDRFVSVDYWTFDDRQMEKLRPQTELQCKGSLIEKGSAFLVTKPYPLTTALNDHLNKPLTQIVSRKDVEQLARTIFGSHFERVEIARSNQTDLQPQQAKRLTLVIRVFLKDSYEPHFAELDQNRIEYELQQRALLSYPFCIQIHHNS